MEEVENMFKNIVNQDYVEFQMGEFGCHFNNELCRHLGITTVPAVLLYYNNQYYQLSELNDQQIIQLLITTLNIEDFKQEQSQQFIIDITEGKIDNKLEESEWNVVYFVDDKCQRCQYMMPMVNDLAKHFINYANDPESELDISPLNNVSVVKINCDHTSYCKSHYSTLPIPGFLLYNGKKYVKQLHNIQQIQRLINEIETNIDDIVQFNMINILSFNIKQFNQVQSKYVCLVFTKQGIQDESYNLEIKKLVDLYQNSDIVTVGYVNCKAESKLCSKFNIAQYPSIYLTYEQNIIAKFKHHLYYDNIKKFIENIMYQHKQAMNENQSR